MYRLQPHQIGRRALSAVAIVPMLTIGALTTANAQTEGLQSVSIAAPQPNTLIEIAFACLTFAAFLLLSQKTRE